MATEIESTRSAHGDGLPRWDGSKRQYTQRIGYMFNSEKQRVRKPWNLGNSYLDACGRAIGIRKIWVTVVLRQIWPEFRLQARALLPSYDWSKPVWPESWMLKQAKKDGESVIAQVKKAEAELASLTEEAAEASERIAAEKVQTATDVDPHAIARYLAKQGLVAVPANSPLNGVNIEEVTIAEAKDQYLAVEKDRIGRGGGKGQKVRSYNTRRKNLLLVLGLTTAKDEPRVTDRSPINTARMLRSVEYPDLQKIVNYWLDLPKGVDSDRTAINYLRELNRFLKWCERQKRFGFVRPQDSDELFTFSVPKSKKAADYEPDVLRGLLNSGSEKCKLFQLLAANGGLYQQDISILRHADLIIHKGQRCLWWIRSKEELVEGEHSTFRILTPLWPETYELLLKYQAPKQSPQDWLLLNEAGTQLVWTAVDKQTSDAVSKAFNEAWTEYVGTLANPPAKKFTFKQWRKIGWNIIKRLDNKFMANFWAGQRISGVDFSYDDAQPEDYDPVFPVVEKYRQKLIADKVLEKTAGSEQADGTVS